MKEEALQDMMTELAKSEAKTKQLLDESIAAASDVRSCVYLDAVYLFIYCRRLMSLQHDVSKERTS